MHTVGRLFMPVVSLPANITHTHMYIVLPFGVNVIKRREKVMER